MIQNTIYTSGKYLDRNPSWHAEDAGWKAKHVADMIHRNDLSPAEIAEIGCGSGEILVQLNAMLKNSVPMFGYDISPQAYEIAKVRQTQTLQFYLTDLTEQDVHYDMLLVCDVIEHVDNYIGFTESLKARCNWAIFHIPLDLSVQTVSRPSSLGYVRGLVGHLHYFTEQSAIATIEHCGFEVVDYFLTASAVELNGGGWKRKLARIPRWTMGCLSKSLSARILGGYSIMILAKSPDRSPEHSAHD